MKKKRFHIIGKRVLYTVVERTGKYEFDEPVGSFPKKNLAKIFCNTMNERWELQEQAKKWVPQKKTENKND